MVHKSVSKQNNLCKPVDVHCLEEMSYLLKLWIKYCNDLGCRKPLLNAKKCILSPPIFPDFMFF